MKVKAGNTFKSLQGSFGNSQEALRKLKEESEVLISRKRTRILDRKVEEKERKKMRGKMKDFEEKTRWVFEASAVRKRWKKMEWDEANEE